MPDPARLLAPLAIAALLFAGAIFGFFYAWVCSTMWGLDAADPEIAIAAMQAMNASVRNPVFAPAFFGTPAVLAAAALVAWTLAERRAASLFGAAAGLYVLGAMVPTVAVNVPLNQALAAVAVPLGDSRAGEVWRSYSQPWQAWNAVRAVAAGVALLLAGWGALGIGRVVGRPGGG
ncbi:MAG: DUF1772 domain-containing protein [Defluviicoccus sp.]|nr:DUF1772 domain-containing protein [Defluviicoccus sp.]MDE0384058.1 DUF1772 domain-containing protein [Defluviicoccus sp.]